MQVHLTYLGGGFGRRQDSDFVAQAVEVSKAVRHPIQLIWSREQDLRHGTFRPKTHHALEAASDEAGMPIAWVHRIEGQGSHALLTQGIDDMPYAIPNKLVHLTRGGVTPPVRPGPWRGVARSQNTYVTECFLDELAALAEIDPVAFRRRLLGSAPRHRAVLDAVAQQAGWEREAPRGRTRGVALNDNFGAICGIVAEVSVEAGRVAVHTVHCVADLGRVVHPDGAIAQLEGGIVFGLSSTLHGEITVAGGRVEQGGFDDYPLLRMGETPDIHVQLIGEGEDPLGAGETSSPAVAPAVANAVRLATGTPVRRLPIRPLGGS